MSMSFVKVWFDFEDRTEMLNEVEKGRLLLAMLRYAQGKELPELRGGERFLFPVFKMDIDRDANAYNTRIENGAKGGRPKKETEENRTEPNITESPKNKEQRTKNKEEEQKNKEQGNDNARESEPIGFDDFWIVYPRKVSKQAAIRAWTGGQCGRITSIIVEDVNRRVATEWHGQDMQFIPHPATYLHQRRWEDETQPQERKDGRTQLDRRPKDNPAQDYAQRGNDYYENFEFADLSEFMEG